MARFNAGDRVHILSTVATPFAGLDGLISTVNSNDRGIVVLDKYEVTFSWGERRQFYDVQLQLADNDHRKSVAA